MAKIIKTLYAFNRGIISPYALARVDLGRMALSAEIQTNYMPKVLGSMMLRPGLGYTGTTRNNMKAIHIPFIFATDDTAILELTDQVLRVKVNEIPVTRPSVATTVTNGNFTTDLSGWTNEDEAGASSSWVTPGYMALSGTSINAAKRSQQVTVSGSDANVQHALTIVVTRGPVTLNVGVTDGDDSYISATLKTGTHSLSFTPTGNFYIQVANTRQPASLIDSINIASAGIMEIPTPWLEADLGFISSDQSADVVFLDCFGYQQRRIERRSTTSWSVVLYESEDGPFMVNNLTTITLTPSAITGDITITASKSLFKSTQVGGLFRIESIGQAVGLTATGANQFTSPIKVTGVGASRGFTINISGTWSANVVLQSSVGDTNSWTDVATYTTNQTNLAYNDGLDNQIIYYRLGIETGNYTSGSAVLALSYASGSIPGIVRITGYNSNTSVSAAVLTALGGTAASATWAEGFWSDYRGWPSAVCLYEGRLFHAGKAYIWGSISDAFESFNDAVEGDAGPISRSLGSGPVDKIGWLMPLQRLIIGTQGAEKSARSSSFDEPLTPTNFNIKNSSTQGSARVQPVLIDINGVFVQRGTTQLYEMAYNPNGSTTLFDYTSSCLSTLYPESGDTGLIRLAVQRQTDTRIHCVRTDGKTAVLVYDKAEDVKGWVMIETDGVIEDAFVLPGDNEDKVYYLVARTINGSTIRTLERWAEEIDCQGDALNKQADSFISYTGVPTTTISAPHLPNTEVVIWADGIDQGTFTTNGSGNVTLPSAVSNYIIGLYYQAQFKSTKLVFSTDSGASLTQPKRVNYLGFVMKNTSAMGVKYGSDFDNLDDLPQVEAGEVISPNYVWPEYDHVMFEFNGTFDTDSRVCFQSEAPKPATILAAVIGMQTNAKE